MSDHTHLSSVKEVGISSDPNPRFRRTMEDAHIVCDKFGGEPTQGFFGIYDGHGGRAAVDYVVNNLHTVLGNQLEKYPEDPQEALKQAFIITDAQIGEHKIETSGSTAVTALLRKGVLYIANCGDARAVIGIDGKAQRLSHDHKGTDEAEVKRIVDLGGFVVLNRVNGVLAVTRAFGDHNMKEFVTAEPFITSTPLQTPGNTIIILACDGLWDVISDQEAIDEVTKDSSKSAQELSSRLLKIALDNGSTDNISIMVIKP